MDINEMRKKYREKRRRIQEEKADFLSIDTDIAQNESLQSPNNNILTITDSLLRTPSKVPNYFVRQGDNSSITLSEVSYKYDRNKLTVKLYADKLQNDSNWRTGCLKVICWISSCKYNFEESWGDEDDVHIYIGEQVLGDLEEGYDFSNIKCNFDLSDISREILDECQWNFVFTINELSEDDQWLIIEYRNGETENSSSTDDEDEDYVLSNDKRLKIKKYKKSNVLYMEGIRYTGDVHSKNHRIVLHYENGNLNMMYLYYENGQFAGKIDDNDCEYYSPTGIKVSIPFFEDNYWSEFEEHIDDTYRDLGIIK